MSLRLGFELYRILFLEAIVEWELYKQQLKNNTNDRILQFLLSSTEEQDTRRRYMDVLSDLCLLFVNSNDVEKYHRWVLPCFARGKERELPKELSQCSVMSLEQKCNRIVDCYHQVSDDSKRAYFLDKRALEVKIKKGHKYQTLR